METASQKKKKKKKIFHENKNIKRAKVLAAWGIGSPLLQKVLKSLTYYTRFPFSRGIRESW